MLIPGIYSKSTQLIEIVVVIKWLKWFFQKDDEISAELLSA